MSAPAVHHVGLTVSDLDRALAFWRDGLGMDVVMDQTKQGGYFEAIVREPGVDVHMVHLAFAPDGPRVELFAFRSPEGRGVRSRPADVGFAHVCVTVDDVESVLGRLVAAGGHAYGDVVEIDTGANRGGRAVYVRDPDGHTVELFQRARRGEGGGG